MTNVTPLGPQLIEFQLTQNINDLVDCEDFKLGMKELGPRLGASQNESFFNDRVSELVEFVSDELDALDLSVIPDGVRNESFFVDSVLDESQRVDNPNNLKPLVLENTGISDKGWCRSCVVCQGKDSYNCQIM